jgi:hypothetical protein
MESKLNKAFKEMMKCCPLEVAAYGACVALKADSMEKMACDAQFAAMKKCFRRVRKR